MNGYLESEDLMGIPSELLSQINNIKLTKQINLYELIAMSPEGMCLDKILIGMYKIHGVIYNRIELTSYLYRMKQKGLLVNVKKRRGWYKANQEPLTQTTKASE